MNQQIEKLIKEAGTDSSGKWMSMDHIEKFAELLLEESIRVMMENDYHGEWLGEKLKEHFGVCSNA